MPDVFVSYAHEDSKVADDIEDILTTCGIDFFRDVKSIAWGDSIDGEVKTALNQARAVLVIISPASLKSYWVHYEIGFASALGKRVLPFLTHPSLDVPGYIINLRHLDNMDQAQMYFSGEFKTALEDAELSFFEAVSETELNSFLKAAKKMPKLIAEMREDIASDDSGVVREFIVLPGKGVIFNSRKPRFAYYEDEHENLLNKIDILDEYGFLQDVSVSDTPIYRMTEEFLELLKDKSLSI